MSKHIALPALTASIPAFYHFLAPKPETVQGLFLPVGYGYVVSCVVSAIWVTFLMGVKVGSARKAAQVPYPYVYAEKAVAEKNRDAHLFKYVFPPHTPFQYSCERQTLMILLFYWLGKQLRPASAPEHTRISHLFRLPHPPQRSLFPSYHRFYLGDMGCLQDSLCDRLLLGHSKQQSFRCDYKRVELPWYVPTTPLLPCSYLGIIFDEKKDCFADIVPSTHLDIRFDDDDRSIDRSDVCLLHGFGRC